MRPIPIICLLLVLSGLVPVVLAGEAYVFVTAWGSFGTGDGQFGHITGVSVHDPLFVYVSEYYWLPNETHPNHRIQKFGQSGTFIQSFGGSGSGEGRLLYPMDVATDSAGNVYVADAENHRIQKFTSTGTYLASWGSMGSGDGEFYIPVGIAVDGAGTIYVADRNHRIQKFTSTGTFLMKWGEKGDAAGQFNWLQGIATDSAGNVYVVDSENYRIQKFTSTGTYLASWGSRGEGDGQFLRPWDVAVDAEGNVYVADSGNDRVQKFTSTGTYLASWGSTGEGDGQLDFPTGIAVDADGNVYVGDGDNRRIQKFRRTSLSVTSPDGESWVPTRTYPITWTQEGLSGTDVRIELWRVGADVPERTIAASTHAVSGTYSWTVPRDLEPGTDYRVRVVSLVPNGPDDFSGPLTITSRPVLAVTSPEDGESWAAGRTVPITWTQERLSGTNVTIELFTGGVGHSRVGTIASSWPASAGTYSWTIPADQEPGTNYVVSVSSLLTGGPQDYSDHFFSIVSSPALTVTSPESGDSWAAGTIHPVTWTQEGLSGTNVKIELYTGGMGLAKVGTIASVWPAGAGTYSWTIPADLEPGTRYLVKVTSLLSGGPEDYAGFVTLVSSPALTVTSPESGDSWIAGTVHPVTWTQEGLSGTNVRIELYTGGMDLARVGTIAAVWPAGAGTYSWKIPADQEPGTRYLVKVTSLLSGGPEDYSGSLTITHLTPTPTPRPFPNSGLPQDLDRDGRYEDVNGNGRADFADVVLYFNQMTWIAANEPIALFDYNVNGRIDFADVVWLFNTL